MTDTEEPTEEDQLQQPPEPLWLSYAKLFRLPNVFTAWADIIMGYLVVSRFSLGETRIENWTIFGCLLLGSSLIYIAGMILNDYFDLAVDQQQRPERPLPSGKINAMFAGLLGSLFLITGTGISLLAGYLFPGVVSIPWRGGLIALVLSTTVILYDGLLKKTVIAPWLMGSCRFFNILLGMSLATKLASTEAQIFLGYDSGQLVVAGSIGLFIVGVTWFARNEATSGYRTTLYLGVALMLVAVAVLGCTIYLPAEVVRYQFIDPLGWWGLLTLLTVALFRRCVLAIVDPVPAKIQAAVKQAIFSLILLDAAVVLGVCGSVAAIFVVALLFPMLLFGRVIYST